MLERSWLDLYCNILESDMEVVLYVRRHFLLERELFERRIGVLVGALDKVGLIP